jgi:hypothetical protein
MQFPEAALVTFRHAQALIHNEQNEVLGGALLSA